MAQNLKTDFVAIGGGGAGLVAALTVAEAGADAIEKTEIQSAGDLIVGTGSGTITRLPIPSGISAGDGDRVLTVIDDDPDHLEWVKHMSNIADLNYVTTATYNVNYATDHIIVGAANSNMVFSFTEP